MSASAATNRLAGDVDLALRIAAGALGESLFDLSLLVRAYATEALLIVHPGLPPEQALSWTGSRPRDAEAIARTMSDPAWDDRIPDRIAGAIIYRDLAADTNRRAAQARDVSSEIRRRVSKLKPVPGQRVVVHDSGPMNFTAALMGDPPPGRSAAEQQRRCA